MFFLDLISFNLTTYRTLPSIVDFIYLCDFSFLTKLNWLHHFLQPRELFTWPTAKLSIYVKDPTFNLVVKLAYYNFQSFEPHRLASLLDNISLIFLETSFKGLSTSHSYSNHLKKTSILIK